MKNKVLLVLVCSLLFGNNMYAQDKAQSIDFLNNIRCMLIKVKQGLDVAKTSLKVIHPAVNKGLNEAAIKRNELGKIRDDSKKQVNNFLNYFNLKGLDLSGVVLKLACLDQVKSLVDSAIGIMSTIHNTMGVAITEFRRANEDISPKAPIYIKMDIVIDRINLREKRLAVIIKELGGSVKVC